MEAQYDSMPKVVAVLQGGFSMYVVFAMVAVIV